MSETIAVFGATGATGKHVVAKALKAGYLVRVLARTPSKIDSQSNLTIIKGTFADRGAIAQVVEGADYIVSCAGGVIGSKDYDDQMMTNFVKLLYQVLAETNSKVKVVLYQGGAFTLAPGEKSSFGKALMKLTAARMIGLLPMVKDNDSVCDFMTEQKSVVSFDMIYTRPGYLVEKDEKPLKASEESNMMAEITFSGLASFTLAALKDKSLYGSYPYPLPAN